MEVRAILVTFIFYNVIPNDLGQKCGRLPQTSKLSGKIVGGYDIGYYKYPWYAALLLDGIAWCGGTLVGPSTIVTAAHCFKEYIVANQKLEDVFKVRLGIYNNCISEKTQTDYDVKKVYVHEKYIKKQPYFDIALLILNGDTSKYEEACLPSKPLNQDARGMEGLIIGLGTLKYGTEKYPCNLHEARILIYPDKTCMKMIHEATDDKEDYDLVSAFCAGYLKGGTDACQGDSGGPLLIQNENGRYVILGLTSFGYDCAQKDLLGIYTDVSSYGKWIKEKAGVSSQLITTAMTTISPFDSTESGITTTPNENAPNFIDQQINPSLESATDFPIFPWTYPSTDRPPMIYTQSNVNKLNPVAPMEGGFFPSSPPKRIIIEYRNPNAVNKEETVSKTITKKNHHKIRNQKKNKHKKKKHHSFK